MEQLQPLMDKPYMILIQFAPFMLCICMCEMFNRRHLYALCKTAISQSVSQPARLQHADNATRTNRRTRNKCGIYVQPGLYEYRCYTEMKTSFKHTTAIISYLPGPVHNGCKERTRTITTISQYSWSMIRLFLHPHQLSTG